MDTETALRICAALERIAGGGKEPAGVEAVVMALAGGPNGDSVADAINSVAESIRDLAQAVREHAG